MTLGVAVLLGLAGAPQAQQLPAQNLTSLSAPEPRVKLDLTLEQVHLVTQTLNAVDCRGSVAQFVVCQEQVIPLLHEILRQAKEQVK